MNKVLLTGSVAGLALLSGNLAYAVDDATTSAATVIEEVIVTAQKRAQSLQKIPVAVTAVTAGDLENKFMVNLQDIKEIVPNLYLEEALGSVTTPKAFMRGVGVDNQVFSFDTPIGFYVDGVYYARATGALVDLFDVERIEVLRGPQGTLYGRNSSVGAIRVITRDPNLQDVEFMADATVGSKNQINSRLSVSVPMERDKLGMRLALSTRNNDGWMTNLTTGEKFQDENVDSGRGSLLFTPNESWRVTLRGDFLFDDSKTRQGSNFLINPDNDIYTFEASPEARFVNSVHAWGSSATVEWAGSGFDITSISAYRELEMRNAADVDGRADVRSFEVDQQDLDEWQFSQELYASGSELGGTPLNWVIGAFYFHEKNEFTWALRIFAPPTTQFFDQDTDTFAVYGQATYPVNDRLSLTGGLRYTYEKKAIEAIQFLPDGALNTSFDFMDSITANKVTWRAALDYQATDNVLLYASAATGFRSGGFNGSARDQASILGGSFGPEDSFTIEGGAKTDLLEGRMRLNIGYFYAEYSDLQLAITRSDGTITSDNVNASVHGLEAELTVLPVEGLEITGTLGSMFDDIEDSDLELKNTPEWSFRLGAIYSIPVPALDGSVRLGADISYNTDSFSDTNNGPFTNTGNYEIVNANITYESEDGHWALSLAGFNLTDQFVNIHSFNIAGGFISSVHFTNTPRRWAATLRYKF